MTNQDEPQPSGPSGPSPAQPPQPPPAQPSQPPPQSQPGWAAHSPYPFAQVLKSPWIAPARKAAVIAIGAAAAVVMFGAGIGAGAAIFHNDQQNRPGYQYRLPDFGQRQFPGLPHQIPTPTPTPSKTG